jgi:hypothetical protein
LAPGPPRAQVLKRQWELAQLNHGRAGIVAFPWVTIAKIFFTEKMGQKIVL